MTFAEKSAWIMSFALIVSGLLYSFAMVAAWQAIGHAPPPNIGFPIMLTVPIVAIAILGHAFAAIGNPSNANEPEDERARQIVWRAGNLSGALLGLFVMLMIGVFAIWGDGRVIFHALVLSLLISQLAEYLLTIWFYRRGV